MGSVRCILFECFVYSTLIIPMTVKCWWGGSRLVDCNEKLFLNLVRAVAFLLFVFIYNTAVSYMLQYSRTWLVPFYKDLCAYLHFGSIVLQCYPMHILAAYNSVLPLQLTMTNPYNGSIIIILCTVVSYMLIPILLKMIKRHIFFAIMYFGIVLCKIHLFTFRIGFGFERVSFAINTDP